MSSKHLFLDGFTSLGGKINLELDLNNSPLLLTADNSGDAPATKGFIEARIKLAIAQATGQPLPNMTPPSGSVSIAPAADPGNPIVVDTQLLDTQGGFNNPKYQWFKDGIAISGEEAETYVAKLEDGDSEISYEIEWHDNAGNCHKVTSPTVIVTHTNLPPTGKPSIQGTTIKGRTLSVNSKAVIDPDGVDLNTISYQWGRDGNEITDATGSEYHLTNDDVGAMISVIYTYTDKKGQLNAVVSDPVGPIQNVNRLPTGKPYITGTLKQGELLSARTQRIEDLDGVGELSYQWYRNTTPIPGANERFYRLDNKTPRTHIKVAVSYTDGGLQEETVESWYVGPIANINDDPIGLPVLDGIFAEDQTITIDTRGIQDPDGLGDFSYEWYRNNQLVATTPAYTLTQADVGFAISAAVAYTDGFGKEEKVYSLPSEPVLNVNDLPTGAPLVEFGSISGELRPGEPLSVDLSSISDEDGIGEINIQWLKDGMPIEGETGPTYLLKQTDGNSVISVKTCWEDIGGVVEVLISSGYPLPMFGPAPLELTGTVDGSYSVESNTLSTDDIILINNKISNQYLVEPSVVGIDSTVLLKNKVSGVYGMQGNSFGPIIFQNNTELDVASSVIAVGLDLTATVKQYNNIVNDNTTIEGPGINFEDIINQRISNIQNTTTVQINVQEES